MFITTPDPPIVRYSVITSPDPPIVRYSVITSPDPPIVRYSVITSPDPPIVSAQLLLAHILSHSMQALITSPDSPGHEVHEVVMGVAAAAWQLTASAYPHHHYQLVDLAWTPLTTPSCLQSYDSQMMSWKS